MYCGDTGSIPALDKDKLVHIPNLSVADARWIGRTLATVRTDSESGNGELTIVVVGKAIKKIKTTCEEFCENIADNFSRKLRTR